jgi:hypothetical protein
VTVLVTRHAAEQARSRAGLDECEVRAAVELALAEGRQSRSRPEFLAPGSDARRDGFYAWTPDERAAFIVLARGSGHVVVTTLTPDEREPSAPAEREPTKIEQAFAVALERAGDSDSATLWAA